IDQSPVLSSLFPYTTLFRSAILFSDILVIPQAMNIEVQMKPNFGPYLPKPVQNQKGVDEVMVPDVNVELDYVMQAIKATKELLRSEEHTSELQSRENLVCRL